MSNARGIADLIMMHSEKWVDHTIEHLGVNFGNNRFVYNIMLLETNIFFAHLYDREVFRLFRPMMRKGFVDELLKIWPVLLAKSLNPQNRALVDEAMDVILLFNTRQLEYGCYPIANEHFAGYVVHFFSEYFCSLLDKKANPPTLQIALQAWAIIGMRTFVGELMVKLD